MLQGLLESVLKWLRRVITQPVHELNRWQQAVRSSYDLGRFGARQLRHDRAQHMAAALSFRTLFSLLPVMVVATLLVKGLIGVDKFIAITDDVLSSIGLDTLRILPASGSGGQSITLSLWLKDLFEQAATVSVESIRWVGVAVMVYAAISLLVTIENCFNVIVRAPVGRRWTRRVPLYWFVLTVSPLAVFAWYSVNGWFDTWIASVETWNWLLYLVLLGWNLLGAWLLMLAVYTLMPSSSPQWKPAAIGAAVSAMLLVIGLRGFGAYLNNAFTIGQLYGSLGLIPLFMFWVYLMWLAVLFGLEVAAILQALPGRRLEELERERKAEALVDPAAVMGVMEVIGERFLVGQPSSLLQLCERTGLPEVAVSKMLSGLAMENLIHRLEGPADTVTLARSPDQISGVQLLEIAFRLVDYGDAGDGSALLGRLRQAQRDLVEQTTLAGLVTEN